jgi:hypothetical protein
MSVPSTLASVRPTFNSQSAWEISLTAKKEIQFQIETFELILEMIESAAEEGFCSLTVPEPHKNVWIELDNRGFGLQQSVGDTEILITW